MIRRITHTIAGFSVLILFSFSSCTISELEPGRRYALVYGVGTYTHPQVKDLPNATTDGEETAALFLSQGIEVLNTHTHGAIDAEQFRLDIAQAQGVVKDNDIFLFYFAGHGLNASGEGIIAFSDYGGANSSGSIQTSELIRGLQSINSLHTVAIIDACNSASSIPAEYGVDTLTPDHIHPINFNPSGKAQGIAESIENYFTTAGKPGNISMMAASGSAEESYEWSEEMWREVGGLSRSVVNNGVFTGFFLESANVADSNGDGLVTLSESYSYVFHKIDSTWNAYYKRFLGTHHQVFYPHISGNGLDPVLFSVDR